MFEKITGYLKDGYKWVSKRTKKMKFSNASMKYIYWYAISLALFVIIYLLAWIFIWFIKGTPDLDSLLKIIHEMAGSTWVAVVGFIAQALVDKNNTGVPDIYEENNDKDKKKKELPLRE